jgi:hypothetical protein
MRLSADFRLLQNMAQEIRGAAGIWKKPEKPPSIRIFAGERLLWARILFRNASLVLVTPAPLPPGSVYQDRFLVSTAKKK